MFQNYINAHSCCFSLRAPTKHKKVLHNSSFKNCKTQDAFLCDLFPYPNSPVIQMVTAFRLFTLLTELIIIKIKCSIDSRNQSIESCSLLCIAFLFETKLYFLVKPEWWSKSFISMNSCIHSSLLKNSLSSCSKEKNLLIRSKGKYYPVKIVRL